MDATSGLGLVAVLALAILSLAMLLYGLSRGLRRGIDLVDPPRFEHPPAGPGWASQQMTWIERRRVLVVGCSLALVLLAAACLIYTFSATLLR